MAPRAEGATYIYEVFPVNFIMLPEERRDEVIGRFACFLNSLSSEAAIHIVKSEKSVEIGGETYEAVYNRFFLESRGEPIDRLLQYAGFKYQRTTEVPWVKPVKVFAKHRFSQAGG